MYVYIHMYTYICITLWSRFPWIALFIESFTHSFTPSFCSYFGTIASRYSSPCCMGVWQPRGSDSLDYNKHNHNNIISSSLPPWGMKSAGWRRRVANYLAILLDLRPSGIWLLDGGAERGRGGGDPFPWCEHPDCEIQGPVSCDQTLDGQRPALGLQGTTYLYIVMSCRLLRQGRHSTQNPAQEELLRGTSKTSTTIGSARESRTRIWYLSAQLLKFCRNLQRFAETMNPHKSRAAK